MTLAFAEAVDIGYGRGRLAAEAARSLARVDADFGRPADINEAWRSPEQANANYARYIRYLNGGPWAPIALPADESVHCVGYAVDTDDTSDAQMRIWNDHGWYWTVYRNGKLAERWHLEYFRDRDNHRNDPAPAGSNAKPFEEDDMFSDEDRARAKNIETMLGGLQNAIGDPNHGVAKASVEASERAGNAANIASEVRNLILDPTVGILQAIGKLDDGGDRPLADAGDVDLAAIASAVADEQDRRARERLAG